MIRCPSASRLPVRRKNGTPAQRQLSIAHFSAMKVSVSDSRVDALLGPVADVLPAHDVLRARCGSMLRKTLFFSSLIGAGSSAVGGSIAMKPRIWNRWVTTMSRNAPGRLVEAGALAEPQRLRHVDLHVVDEVPVPDRLEQAVGEAERQDVLRRLLAEEVVDAEDLLLGEDLVQPGVQRHGAGEVGAEGLLHDDAAAARRDRPRPAAAPPAGRRLGGTLR